MMRNLFLVMMFILMPILSFGEDLDSALKDKHLPFTNERMDAALGMAGTQNFQEVIKLLRADRFQEAGNLLSVKIEASLKAFENNLVVYDKEPKIDDCIILKYLIDILRNDVKGAESDCALMQKINPAAAKLLKEKISSSIKEAQDSPVGFKDTIKKSAQLIWETKDYSVPVGRVEIK